MDKQQIYEQAVKMKRGGYDVIPDDPIRKYPYGWHDWQKREFSEEDLRLSIIESKFIDMDGEQKYSKNGYALGVRNIEGLDIENKGGSNAADILKLWFNDVKDKYPDILDRLIVEKSQSGGIHLIWKCDHIGQSVKLARRHATPEELKNGCDSIILMIETRGQGGQFCIAPSPGYELKRGDWLSLPKITKDERDAIIWSAQKLNQVFDEPRKIFVPSDYVGGDDKPGTVYNSTRSDHAFQTLLNNGWKESYRAGDTSYMIRPGKEFGTSATFGYKENLFYVFSSNAHPFDNGDSGNGKGYMPFTVYTILEHNGDFSQAAKTILRDGIVKMPDKQDFPQIVNEEKIPDYPRTDSGNAELFAKLYSNEAKFNHLSGSWLIWHGTQWKPDNIHRVIQLAKLTARFRLRQASDVEDKVKRREAVKFAFSCESKSKINAMLELAKSEEGIADDGMDWDTNSWLLGCKNGVIDLRKGELVVGNPADRVTMNTYIEYDPHATCPRFMQFLGEVFGGNEEIIDFVHKAMGYSITGDMREQKVFLGSGIGANGKSTLLRSVMNCLGDYAFTCPKKMFLKKSDSENTNHLAAAKSKRFMIISEVSTSSRVDEKELKEWSGGEPIQVRFLHQEYFEFQPMGKVWMFMNHPPKVDDGTHSFWRRVVFIPFNKVFAGQEIDPELPDKLKAESQGILNWLVQGCMKWQSEGLTVPQFIADAIEVYREENDPIAEFVNTSLKKSPGSKLTLKEIYKKYTEWARDNEVKPLGRNNFGTKLESRFTKGKKSNQGKTFDNVAFLSQEQQTLLNVDPDKKEIVKAANEVFGF
jgi:putative DNA primase/helicase